jgi:hypothetical protein
MAGRSRARTRAAAALVPAAGVAVLALGTGTASAAFVQDEAEFTYTNTFGEKVTCLVASTNEFEPALDDVAFVSTVVSGDDECAQSFVTINVTYLLPGHRPASGSAGGFGEAFGSFEPVAEDFRSEHLVDFLSCDLERSDCRFEVTLVQPK